MDIRNYVGTEEQKKKIPTLYFVVGGAGIFILLILIIIFANVKKRVSERGTEDNKEGTTTETGADETAATGDELLEDMWIDDILLYSYEFTIENKNEDDSYLGDFLSARTADRYFRITGYNMGHSFVGVYQSSDGEDSEPADIKDLHTRDAVYMVREGNFVRSDGILTKLKDDISPTEMTDILTTVFLKACDNDSVEKKVVSSGKNGDSGHYIITFPEGGVTVDTGHVFLDRLIHNLSDGTELSVMSKGSRDYRTVTITGENANYYYIMTIKEEVPNFVLEEDFSEYESE